MNLWGNFYANHHSISSAPASLLSPALPTICPLWLSHTTSQGTQAPFPWCAPALAPECVLFPFAPSLPVWETVPAPVPWPGLHAPLPFFVYTSAAGLSLPQASLFPACLFSFHVDQTPQKPRAELCLCILD